MSDGSLAPARRFPWVGVVRWALSLLLLGVVGQMLHTHWDEVKRHAVALSPGLAVPALVGLALYLVLACEGWRRIMGALGEHVPYAQAFRILFVSNLAKYLPGGLWNLVGRVVMCERLGIAPVKASVTVLMETACQVVAALLVGLLALPSLPGLGGALGPGAVGAVVGVIVCGMHPRVLNGWLALGERLTGKPLPRLPFSFFTVLGLLAFYVANWLLLGASFALLAQAMYATPLSLSQVSLLVGAFAVAWNVGVFAFFVPAGLGAREAALVLLLGSAFPPAWPAALAIVARLWFIVGEVLVFLVASSLKAAPRREAPDGPTLGTGP